MKKQAKFQFGYENAILRPDLYNASHGFDPSPTWCVKDTIRCLRARSRAFTLAVISLFCGMPAAAQSTWMGDLKSRIGHFPLNYLAIPGTHDSGTYSLDPNSSLSVDFALASVQTEADNALNSVPLIGGGLASLFDSTLAGILNPIIYNWAVAQDPHFPYSFTNQLNAGIRYFDIRSCPYPNPTPQIPADIRVCHSLFGASLSEVLNQVKQFSLANPDEIIILDFNHIGHNEMTGDNEASSQTLAATIKSILTNVNPGDMLIPFPTFTPKSTLAQIWAQPARIIALYDDLGLAGGLLWPGQVPGAAATIDTPWPSVNNAPAQFAADQSYLNCRCGGPGDNSMGQLFVLQTNPTPDNSLLGGYIINQIENDTGGVLNFALEPLRNSEGWASSTPSGLRDLDDQANGLILPWITQAILASNGALRNNLNIVQADRFQEQYDLSNNIIPSNFVNFMVALDTPPQSTLSIGAPQYSGSQQLFVTSATPFTIQATDTYFGVLNISYDYNSVSFDSTPHQSREFVPYINFTLAAPAPDGLYTVTSFATNIAGVSEAQNKKQVTLDNTPPVITVTQPAASFAYPHSSTLILNYGVTDGSGSGVQSVTSAVLDGAGAIGGHTLTSGLAINLLTQLPLGSHTFTFGGATDNVGNISPAKTVTFTVIVTADSIKADVTQFEVSGAISDANWSSSLSDKLNQAAAFGSSGDCTDAASVYNAFINEVSAQSGKKVTPIAAGIMINDAQYMIAHCQ